jgi:ribose 1,5-bisphosphate isomerase
MSSFERICRDIKGLKIQGAENIAKAALEALKYRHDKKAIKRIVSLRPTEPALRNAIALVLSLVEKGKEWGEAIEIVKNYLYEAEEKTKKYGASIIKDNCIIYTHCHSSTVESVLELAKKKGKSFVVYVTETRPLFQGRITAERLAKKGIRVVLGVDGYAYSFLKKADMFLFGADAITSNGDIINKVGTGMFAELANHLDVPCYCLTTSLKYDPITRYGYEEIIEERSFREVWNKKIKNLKIVNPAFEIVEAKNVNAIVSEFGILSITNFLSEANKIWEDRIVEKLKELKEK